MAENPPKRSRKTRKRRNRDARPYRRASDGKWVAVCWLPNGKRRPVYGDSAEEAEDKRKTLLREVEERQPVTVGRRDTVGKYLLDVWLAVTLPQRVAAGRLAPSTLDSYRDMCEKHIVPLGRVKLVDLGTVHVRAWLLELAAKPSGRVRKTLRPGEDTLPEPEPLSARTCAYAHAVLRKALADAVDDELVRRNVCLLVDPPVVARPKQRELTKDEARALLGAAAGSRLWAYWLLLLALGLRRGEGLGLRWSGVDLERGTVRLQMQVQRLRGEKDPETGRRRGRLVARGLKTEASRATVRLPAYALAALREHRDAQAAERETAKVWVDEDLVFTTTAGTAIEPQNISRAWAELCDRAEVGRTRVHDLRHATAGFLFAEGVDLRVIQGVLRHTRLATTAEIYSYLLDEVRDAATESMDGVLIDLTSRARTT